MQFDVFLSHNGRDKPTVKVLGTALKQRNLSVWLDEWELRPGLTWQDALQEIVTECKSALVCFGDSGVGPWEEPEMQALLRRFVSEKKIGNIVPIIPVLLPGAPANVKLPLFLEAFTWVDLRAGLTDEGLQRLEWGITGKKPRDNSSTAALTLPEFPAVDSPATSKRGQTTRSRSSLTRWLSLAVCSLFVISFVTWQALFSTPQLWLPAKIQETGVKASNESQRCRILNKMFETELVKSVGGKEIRFHLVPEFEIPNKDRKIRTFYMMESPVTNAMFNAFATENPNFEMVTREESQRTWKAANDLPVVNIHPLEAQQFANWVVPGLGSLPTTTEWDLASGYYDFVELLQEKINSKIPLETVLSGENRFTKAKFKVGTSPAAGEYQAVGKPDFAKNRSPYGCLYPSRNSSEIFAFGEITASVRDVKQGVENLREWMTDIRQVKLEELLSTAQCQLRVLIKQDRDFSWISSEGDEKNGRCLTAEDLDVMSGDLLLNTSQGGVGFNRNTGFRIVLLTNSLESPGK